MTPAAPTPNPASTPPPAAMVNPVSPPNKRDLKSWWKGFKLQPGKHQDTNGTECLNHVAPAPAPALVAFPSSDNPYTGEAGLETTKLLQPTLAQHDTSVHTHPGLIPVPVVESSDSAPKIRARAGGLGHLSAILVSPLRRLAGEYTPDPTPLAVLAGYNNTERIVAGTSHQGIFGVPLRQSITYANVAISLVDESGSSYIYGYVPIVVAKCGVFLKEKATEVEGIFRLSGSEKRIKELKLIFDSPDRYGKGLVWDGYTVHDASNVFRRYLNDLPEPVVPLHLYEKFREPLRGATKPGGTGDAEGPQFVEGFDEQAAIANYQRLITELPPLNRQLLLYILDLLAVFAAKSEANRMNAQNLAAIFQPGMLSHPDHAMAPEEYRLNQCVLIFLIENQDHFLIGMQGTAADEETKQEVEHGTPTISGPEPPRTPTRPGLTSEGLNRTASNASAAANSVRRDGMIRRNRSTSSRHSRHDSIGSVPGSPAVVTTPTSGLARSNTLPSKKSPALPSGRFLRETRPASPRQPGLPTIADPPAPGRREPSLAPSTLALPAASASSLTPGSAGVAGPSQERLIEPPVAVEPASTPVKERNLQSLFQRSPSNEADRRPRNKLKKRVTPGGGMNPSAQSSTASLAHSSIASPAIEQTNPMDLPGIYNTTPTPIAENPTAEHPMAKHQIAENPTTEHPIAKHETAESPRPADDSSEPTAQGSQIPAATLQPENSLKPKMSPTTSLHSSFNEGSEMDQIDEPLQSAVTADVQEKEKKNRWRLSRGVKHEENTSPYLPVNAPQHARGPSLQGESNTSIASGSRPRKSFTNDSSEPGSSVMESHSGQDPSSGYREKQDLGLKEEHKGPIGWIKTKYREVKETHDQRRAKSPPGDGQQAAGSTSRLSFRGGMSMDLKREEEKPAAPTSQPQRSVPGAPQHEHQAPPVQQFLPVSQETQVAQAPPTAQNPQVAQVPQEVQAPQAPQAPPTAEKPPVAQVPREAPPPQAAQALPVAQDPQVTQGPQPEVAHAVQQDVPQAPQQVSTQQLPAQQESEPAPQTDAEPPATQTAP